MREVWQSAETQAGVDSHFDSMGWELANNPEIFETVLGEVGLFRKVIQVALLDFCSPQKKKPFRHYAAERWLLESEATFRCVCDLADVNADAIREIVRRAQRDEHFLCQLRQRLAKQQKKWYS